MVKKNKKVIYSAMIGNYDNINNITATKDWDCVMFTTLKEKLLPKNSNWNFKPVNKSLGKNNSLVNRWYKMHPHVLFPEYEESIYIDSNIEINNFDFINKRIKELQKEKTLISIPKHLNRNCAYEEAEKIIKSHRDSQKNIKNTLEILKTEKYPRNNGMYENNFIYRKHNDKSIINLMEQWWKFINKYSRRDQMSLCFLLWKNNIKITSFFKKDISTRNCKGISIKKHQGYIPTNFKLFFGIKKICIRILYLITPVKAWRRKLRKI